MENKTITNTGSIAKNNNNAKSSVKNANKGTVKSTAKAGAKGRKTKSKSKSKNIAKKSANIFSKVTFKVAMYVIGVVLVVLVCTNTYKFGVQVFSEDGVDVKGSGREVVVTIPADASVSEVASILKENGLIESELAFRIQSILYEADFYSGTYTLNTEYGPEELIDAMRPEED
jgi:hypothetical protein